MVRPATTNGFVTPALIPLSGITDLQVFSLMSPIANINYGMRHFNKCMWLNSKGLLLRTNSARRKGAYAQFNIGGYIYCRFCICLGLTVQLTIRVVAGIT